MTYGVVVRSSQTCNQMLKLFTEQCLGRDCCVICLGPYYCSRFWSNQRDLNPNNSAQELDVPKVFFEVIIL